MPALHNHRSRLFRHRGLLPEDAPSAPLATFSDIYLLLCCHSQDCPMIELFGSPLIPPTPSPRYWMPILLGFFTDMTVQLKG